MSASKTFQCDNCDAEGKIIIKSEEINLSDVAYCPCCGANILEDEDED
jgi:uncharacterized paraquat-inducible protein A